MLHPARPATLLVARLLPADLPAMHHHLCALDEEDRRQRFAQTASDALIDHYLDHLDFERDAHFGVWHPDTDELLALAHLAVDTAGSLAEVGVSVAANFRRQGLASALLHRCVLHARNLCIAELLMYFLPYNRELIELARSMGMRLCAGDGMGMARLRPNLPDAASVGEEVLETWAAVAARGVARMGEGTTEVTAELCRAVNDLARRG